VECEPCEVVPVISNRSVYYVPDCVAGTCTVVDLRATESTECQVDLDCALRDGTACCEGCDGTGLVALSSTDYLGRSCPLELACPPCVPTIPPDYAAHCLNERCHVVFVSSSGSSEP
jgi:hypothetical protein